MISGVIIVVGDVKTIDTSKAADLPVVLQNNW